MNALIFYRDAAKQTSISLDHSETGEPGPEAVPCDVATLCLVAFIGLEGIDCLRLVHQLVPESFLDLQAVYITRIVNSVLQANQSLSSTKCSQLTSLMKDIPFFQRKSTTDGYLKELQSLSMSTGKAHTAFVAPPVARCIQSGCNQYKVPGNDACIHLFAQWRYCTMLCLYASYCNNHQDLIMSDRIIERTSWRS